MSFERQQRGQTNETVGVNDRVDSAGRVAGQTTTTTTRTKTTQIITTSELESARPELNSMGPTANSSKQDNGFRVTSEVAKVEHLGRQAAAAAAAETKPNGQHQTDERKTSEHENKSERPQVDQIKPVDLGQVSVEGNKFVTSVGTIAAQSSQSRIVVAILRDGRELQLRVQEMRPGMFEVGANLSECRKFFAEHQRLLNNLAKHKQAPIESWLTKYKKLQQVQPEMGAELKLVYLCMAENLQGCWQGLMLQLEQRLQLLEETGNFYANVERLIGAIERADGHVQSFRREFLEGHGSVRFNQAANELKRLNQVVADEFRRAKCQQRRLVELVAKIATGNLADSRVNLLIADGQSLIDFINSYIEPLERRKIQLENVTNTSTSTITSTRKTTTNGTTKTNTQNDLQAESRVGQEQTGQRFAQSSGPIIRQVNNFNDLHLVERWLLTKVDQLNSSLLLSLGANAQDTRSILNKHEQIALECSALEEALLTFRGKSIHAIKSVEQQKQDQSEPNGLENHRPSLLDQQRQLALKARDVINILEARIVLLRRTIDFYSRAKEATLDIGKMMRRLQADNSLQSIQFVADELELKDVSSVVASGATIISELQQLQLAQQHGQRSKAVGLQLETGGIRTVIDQLNQELAHLKTVLNQRRLVLLNEDASKMAQNYSSKCQQLRFWLDSNAKSFLLSNNRIPVDVNSARAYCDQHEELRLALQQKTLEVEALLRLLSSLTKSFDSKSQNTDEIQRETDELRQDWIMVTNCLERRLEIARKYLAILVNACELNEEIDLLSGDRDQERDRPKTPDERGREDIEAHVGQSLVQMANQVRNFTLDAQRANTSLVYVGALETKPAVNDINKQQIIGHANGAHKLLEERLKTTISRLNAARPRKWSKESTQSETKRQGQFKVVRNDYDNNQRSHQNDDAPRFVRQLADVEVEPFSTIVLECELANGLPPTRVDWLLNNKRIPHTIKHSIANEDNRHRLTIGQFSPVCCGNYTARATNQLTGTTAISSCRLRLSGIREDESSPLEAGSSTGPVKSNNRAGGGQLPQSHPVAVNDGANNNKWQQQANKERALQRIIQGVKSPMGHDEQPSSERHLSVSSTAPTSTSTCLQSSTQTTSATNLAANFPVIRLNYDGTNTQTTTDTNRQRISYIDSPASSVQSRSVSRSPFDGTPQPPMFMQTLTSEQQQAHQIGTANAQAGLVCVIIGNPPPNVEWLHEGRSIASAKCARSTTNPRANICKLTIETVNDKTLGRYVCRATNKLGQSSTALTLSS